MSRAIANLPPVPAEFRERAEAIVAADLPHLDRDDPRFRDRVAPLAYLMMRAAMSKPDRPKLTLNFNRRAAA